MQKYWPWGQWAFDKSDWLFFVKMSLKGVLKQNLRYQFCQAALNKQNN
jgi:hypothetical protein